MSLQPLVTARTGVLERCLETCDTRKEALQTNYYGTKRAIGVLLPLLLTSDDGQIIDVSSEFGQLRLYLHFHNKKLRQELEDVDNLTKERLDTKVTKFVRDMETEHPGAAAPGAAR
ncbi:hypothetical protein ACP4OV_007951 [Aristida adscensionis]